MSTQYMSPYSHPTVAIPSPLIHPAIVYGIAMFALGHLIASLFGSCATWSQDTHLQASLSTDQRTIQEDMRRRYKSYYFSALRFLFVCAGVVYICRGSISWVN